MKNTTFPILVYFATKSMGYPVKPMSEYLGAKKMIRFNREAFLARSDQIVRQYLEEKRTVA